MTDAEPAARATAKKAGVVPIVFGENTWAHLSLHLWETEGDQLTQLTEGRARVLVGVVADRRVPGRRRRRATWSTTATCSAAPRV